MTPRNHRRPDRRRRPRRRRRRRLPAPAGPPRAGARARAVPALLDRREPAAAKHGIHRGRGHAARRRRGRLPVQERRRVRVGRPATPTSTSATSSPPAGAPPTRCSARTFDKVLADAAARQGAEIRYRHEVTAIDLDGDRPRVTARDADGQAYEVEARFVLDASGFGRTLPRLLELETPSNFPVRGAIFTHVADRIPAGRPVRPREDPRDGASAAPRRLVLDDPVLQRPLLVRASSRRRTSSRSTPAPRPSACARSSPRSRACRGC